MSTITIHNIEEKKKNFLIGEEFETLLNNFISDYIETKEDLELRNSLQKDIDFHSLNSKLEQKLGTM